MDIHELSTNVEHCELLTVHAIVMDLIDAVPSGGKDPFGKVSPVVLDDM